MGPTILRFHSRPTGESPPPPPRACFGREELIEEAVELAKNLEPVALVGPAGIGKTSIALAVLHDNRIKERFGENRRFIRCDQFPASRTNFLARLSKVIGAGVENPEDLTPLRPFLASKEMFIVLDNAESILDPGGTNSREIYTIVEELCHFETICLCITSRITTIPRYCKGLRIQTLSKPAAYDIFYHIYKYGGRSGSIDDILQRLDFHPLSITLLATVAQENRWDHDRLAKEWDKRGVRTLRTGYNQSLAATIELSLASRTFRELGPNARDLLGVVAFFPQGFNEENLDWVFPTILDRKNIFDKFSVLSLTYRSNGFITMLAPLRDYICPRNPKSSPLLCAAKDRYFTRLSTDPDRSHPDFKEARWIKSEDVNVEHLLDVFTSIDTEALDVWDACDHFRRYLCLQKPRQTVLRSKIEGLSDQHPSKPRCLFQLSRLFGLFGNYAEQKRLLTHTLTLERKRGGDIQVALTSRSLSHVNRMLGLHEEGIQQAREALEVYKRFGDTVGQAECLHDLAWLLLHDDQLAAAEDSASRTIDFLPEKGQEYLLCKSHRGLGMIYDSKGEKEKAIGHLVTALRTASLFDWQDELFWIHYTLALLFSAEGEFDDANAHIVQAKLHAVDTPYKQGRAMNVQAWIWYRQRKLEDAKIEVLGVVEIYEKLGAARDVGVCGELLKMIERARESCSISGTDSEFSGYNVASHPC